MSIYRREIDTQCCTAWMHGIRTINGQYPDDNRDFDINAGNGIRIEPATGGITIINDSTASSFIAGDNIDITPSGDDLVIGLTSDPVINGDLQVNGDIIQNGSAYETHAEKVYTTNDYIITRDGAISALSAGDYSGFQVKKYDGTNDGRLVIDNAGVARVGDVGDEQPLLTREESANLNNGALLKWDAVNQKAIDEGTVGSDTKPIKIVDGVATAVTKDLTVNETIGLNPVIDANYISGGSVAIAKFGNVIVVSLQSVSFIATGSAIECITIPDVNILTASPTPIIDWNSGATIGLMAGSTTGINFWINTTASNIWTTITLLIQ